MAVSKKQIECIHSFQASNRKSVLKVEAVSNSVKGKSKMLDVPATIFQCSKCGAQKEYPNFWEKGFRIL